jgi:hypothetical protein
LRAYEITFGRDLQILLAAGKGTEKIVSATASAESHPVFSPFGSPQPILALAKINNAARVFR